MRRADNHLHVPIVLKSGSLDILEPSGPVQACNGIALPLRLNVLLQYTISELFVTYCLQIDRQTNTSRSRYVHTVDSNKNILSTLSFIMHQ